MPRLSDVVDLLHGWYPPATADSWDAVGLVAGDPGQDVRKVLFAVDPAPAVAQEAAEWGADLLVVHHPLFLKPVHGIARTTPKARTLGRAARRRLRAAHRPHERRPGRRRGERGAGHDPGPDEPGAGRRPRPLAAWTSSRSTCPSADAERLREALAAAGAGTIGDYDSASFSTPGRGPVPAGSPGRTRSSARSGGSRSSTRSGSRWCSPRPRRTAVVAALLAAHPYEEPAYDVVELAPATPAGTGSGRIGDVEPTTLGDFARMVAERLPATAGGVRVGGDPRTPGAPGRGVRGRGRLHARRGARHRRGRLRHQRPPAPSRRASSWRRAGRRWSTCRTGRPSGPGCRWWRRKCGRRWAIRWRPE